MTIISHCLLYDSSDITSDMTVVMLDEPCFSCYFINENYYKYNVFIFIKAKIRTFLHFILYNSHICPKMTIE